jgi:hypothetical protein
MNIFPKNGHTLLPQEIERYVAALAQVYKRKKKTLHQQIIVNSKIAIEEYSYDGLDGGQYGFLLRLQMPDTIFAEIIDYKDTYEEEFRQELNKLIAINGEFIEGVSLEMRLPEEDDWRQSSGLLLKAKKNVSNKSADKIWGESCLRVFLSHKSEFKKQAIELKIALEKLGISAFVAHEDIKPTKEWQNTIENALFSMDIFIALMTPDFHDSNWTDQEVGVAIGREVPIVTIRLGKDPYGFIGKYQGMQGKGGKMGQIASDLFGIFCEHQEIKELLIKAVITRFCNADNFEHANTLLKLIEKFHKIPSNLIAVLEDAPNHNSQVRDAFYVKDCLSSIIRKFKKALS